jgi:hypothetical protein
MTLSIMTLNARTLGKSTNYALFCIMTLSLIVKCNTEHGIMQSRELLLKGRLYS